MLSKLQCMAFSIFMLPFIKTEETIMSVNIFVSYCHEDNKKEKSKDIDDFIRHISPSIEELNIKIWYDKENLAGSLFQTAIDENLRNSDIVCFFVSTNFLLSSACKDEMRKAKELKKRCVYIILSDCEWQSVKNISDSLLLPTDAKPLSSFGDKNQGVKDIWDGLKKVIEDERAMKEISVSDKFSEFLNSSDVLVNAHQNKTIVTLNDIYVYPTLTKINDTQKEEKIDSENISRLINEDKKILIAGEDQSGKTSLCKILFRDLKNTGFFPIYIPFKENPEGIIANKVEKFFKEQYCAKTDFNNIEKNKIVLILDDFHKVSLISKKERIISELKMYPFQIILADDIFALNIKDEKIIAEYCKYNIKQYTPKLRNSLIVKWRSLKDGNNDTENQQYEKIDQTTKIVDETLGNTFYGGILPSYPFFILSVLSSYESINNPLDKEITSSGYCYQALILMYLDKNGVIKDDFGKYLNFLEHISYYFFIKKKTQITENELTGFIENDYKPLYNLQDEDVLIKTLHKSNIFVKDNCGNYKFSYDYLYYYFSAKYLSDNLDDNETIINDIIVNLHKNENAYIAIFICHHTKNNKLLDNIIDNTKLLFKDVVPTTLSKQELSFLDNQINEMVNVAISQIKISAPEKEREKQLEHKEIEEEERSLSEKDAEELANEDILARELRKSIKSVEVIGQIIRNRADSLKKDRIEIFIREGFGTILRILSSFLVAVKNEDSRDDFIEFIISKVKEKDKTQTNDTQLRENVRKQFYLFCFNVINGFVWKAIDSLGTQKNNNIIEKIALEMKAPAYSLFKHGSFMWYSKNVQIDEISKEINTPNFSDTARNIMRILILNHCRVETVSKIV